VNGLTLTALQQTTAAGLSGCCKPRLAYRQANCTYLQVQQAVQHHEVCAQCCLVLLLSNLKVTVQQLQQMRQSGRMVVHQMRWQSAI
jgi:hypothetical protein